MADIEAATNAPAPEEDKHEKPVEHKEEGTASGGKDTPAKKPAPKPAKADKPAPPEQDDNEEGGGESGAEDAEEAAPRNNFFATTVEGGRQRKAVKPLDLNEFEAKKELTIKEGAGKVLGKLEKVVEAVQATSFKDPIFKSIHSLMYSKPVKAQEVKANVLAFSGLVYEGGLTKDKVLEKATKLSVSDLKKACDALAVNRSGKVSKDELAETLVDFLDKPSDAKITRRSSVGVKKPGKARKTSSGKGKTAAGKAKKKRAPKAASKKRPRKADSDEGDSDEDASDEEEEEEAPKKKVVKKKPAKKAAESDDEGEEDVASESEEEEDDEEDYDPEEDGKKKKRKKASPKKTAKKPREESEEEGGSEEEEEEADEETADLKGRIKKIVQGSDTSTLTIKQVLSQLSTDLGKDLSGKKALIKELVTKVLTEAS